MTMTANSHYARRPTSPTTEVAAPAAVKTAAKKAKKKAKTKRALSKVAKSKATRTPVAAAKQLGKSLKRLAKDGLRTISEALPAKGKSKPARKK